MTRKAQQPGPGAYADAADVLGCEIAAIRAVAEVEAGGRAFLPSGEPVILFEPHVFDRLTKGKFRGATAPGLNPPHNALSYPKWRRDWYGPPSAQHARLAAAVELDREAALKSASWGIFQVMGYHYERLGYASVQDFVNAMYRSADAHMGVFVHFIASDEKLHRALQRKDWAAFARIWNGPGFKANKYDERMAEAYEKWRKA